MSNYRLTIQYDGTRYHGWQRQKNGADTIQGKIETALGRMTGNPVAIHGAGRTDAGVHARAQIANFHLTDSQVDRLLSVSDICGGHMDEAVCRAVFCTLNAYLPEDIRILKAERAGERFHSRLHAIGKEYEYHIIKKNCFNVFARRFSWQMEEELCVPAMEEAASCLIGKHDFRAFCSRSSKKKSTVRELRKIDIQETESDIFLRFEGSGFLYNMVRIITGTLVEAGMGKCEPKSVREILEGGERAFAGPPAPAKGLTLWEVKYM